METEALRLLAAVADTGSFTRAAARLNYTQSAVSRRIAALEQRAGGALFERLPRGVRLTPAGRLLHQHALDVLGRLARVERELAALHSGQGGVLHVGAFATANISLLPAALRALGAARPEVEPVVVEVPSAGLMERLADGALDLAVVSDYPYGLPSAEGVVTSVLCEDELLVALPRGHRLAGSGPVDLRALGDEAWVQHAYGDRPTPLADAWARVGGAPRKIIRIAEWSGKFGYVAAGLGVALVPSLAARAVPTDIVLRPLTDPALRRTIHTARPAVPLLSARELEELLRSVSPGRVG
ncbi:MULTISPECIES: LysR family transcriptional regulator [Streptomyces]|uniref:LysR family transcriptional regulator n=1 Tax=Streptomyces tsukubensis (strain DSM 42081 / NBRC 108919 / NRRL 18488 / 9993) TaxID=1114943 RepID=I2N575_STRT9|nr:MULTISPECIES: LysR family transcriptional regulator [Streptomyces]AZK96207.1 LysR family transcriptional regulator [Streptomyces tsukubensis]EIF92172.1 LysR family transcriptional regulator [Streptomyces tsukubensis NRRL18488]MYS67419.1 LysR family transcriptional regulator [Streptomyces sp. SID5473]QKM67782.1 LysR family transcriptional regulator [Streptomyces tsukubensis NRRL18488]TAI44178.1 LysR family transcriptional regulator [Streptomyces tsukubensis]